MQASRTVIVNCPPLLYLHAAGILDLLREMYGSVIVPTGVCRDMADFESKGGSPPHPTDYQWMTVQSAGNPMVLPTKMMGPGEFDTLGLASEFYQPLLLIEGRHLRNFARTRALETTGVLGFLLQAKAIGLLDCASDLIAPLREAGMPISEKVAGLVRQLERGVE